MKASDNKALKDENKLRLEDSAMHNWYRFVLSFPPHLVRTYLNKFGVKAGDTVLDPFCGTGTTLVECKKLGINSVGIEANPIAAFSSKVKTDWDVDADNLYRHAVGVAKTVSTQLRNQGFDDDNLPLFSTGKNISRQLLHLSQDRSKLLLKNSISPLPLHKTLLLIDNIMKSDEKRYISCEKLALAKSIVFGISNLHFGPEVGVGKIKKDAPVVAIWLDNIKSIVNDLNSITEYQPANSIVYQADSRLPHSVLTKESIDSVITSPPYPNEKDYTRTTRLESVLLGFIKDKAELRSLKQSLLRSNTRGVYKKDRDDLEVANNLDIQEIAEAIERRRIELEKTSGFERLYSRVTKLYFGGMTRHLANLRIVLRPGAKLAYVVGDQASYLRVMIRTGQLLADIAQSLGYEVMGIDLFRTRLSTATRDNLREEVVLLKWNGQPAKPRGKQWPTKTDIPR